MKESAEIKYPSPIVFEICRFIGLTASKILWRIKYYNTENIPQDTTRGLLIVPNHQSYVDPVWVSLPVKRKFRYMAYDKAFEWFFIGKVIRYLGSFPVSSDNKGTLKAWRESKAALADKAALIIFPEGAREFADGKMLPFKSGAIRLAIEANVPILPVTVRGGNKVWAQGMKYPSFFHRVEIFFHPAIELKKPVKKEDLQPYIEKITADLQTQIGGLLVEPTELTQ